MRIRRIALRNFRGVADTEVSLATDGVTVIEGPNEVGKSSLAEAIDLILEQPDSSSKGTVKAVKPVHLDEGAEVELELTTGDYHVVYAKRWHKHPQTTLRVLAPTAENHTGREAHDRMKQILDETLDASLWKALRYQQGTTIAQAALGNSLSLSSALDAAASGTALGGADEANLWEQVESERLRYFTPGGKPTTERSRLDQQFSQASVEAVHLREELDRLDAAAERHRRLTDELVQASKQLDGQRQLVATHTAAWEELAAVQRRVDDLAQSASGAAMKAEAAQAAHDDRKQLVEDAQQAADNLRELQAVAQREAPGLAAAQAAHRAAVDRRDAARQSRRDAETANRVAADDYEYFRELMGLELLVERLDRAQRAETKLGEATAFLESCLIDEDKLTEIEDAFVAALETRARLTGESPSIRIEALRNFELAVDGKGRSLDRGQVVEERATQGDLELRLDDLARITVAAGSATRELQDAAAEAEQRLAELYRSAGVTGDGALAEARSMEQRRRSAQRDAEQAAQTLQENLRDLTPQLIAEKIGRAKASTTRYETERATETLLPANRDEAQTRSQQTGTALDRVRQLEEQREEELEEPTAVLEAARTGATERNVRIQLADQHRRSAEQEMTSARATSSDDELARRSAELTESAKGSQAAHQTAASELAAQDPEAAQLILDNAQDVLERMEGDRRSQESELTKVTTELEIRGCPEFRGTSVAAR